MNLEILVPVLVAVVVALPGIWGAYVALRSESREHSELAIDAWRSMVDPMREELEKLHAEVHELQKRAESQSNRIKMLEAKLTKTVAGSKLLVNQIRSRGDEPVWIPTEIE